MLGSLQTQQLQGSCLWIPVLPHGGVFTPCFACSGVWAWLSPYRDQHSFCSPGCLCLIEGVFQNQVFQASTASTCIVSEALLLQSHQQKRWQSPNSYPPRSWDQPWAGLGDRNTKGQRRPARKRWGSVKRQHLSVWRRVHDSRGGKTSCVRDIPAGLIRSGLDLENRSTCGMQDRGQGGTPHPPEVLPNGVSQSLTKCWSKPPYLNDIFIYLTYLIS